MMKTIPSIAFFKKCEAEIEFDIFTVRNLFLRQDQLDHPLDEPQRAGFYHIIYITKGKGIHYIDFHPYHYVAGNIVFISKGQVHAFDVQSDIDGFLMLFTDDFISKDLTHSDILYFLRLYNYHLYEPIMQPEVADGEVIKNMVKEMYWEYQLSNNFAKDEILRLLLKLLLLRAQRFKRTLIPKKKNAEWFVKFNTFRNQLEKHFRETRNAKDYAEMMNISYKRLNEICKATTGTTAKMFINNYIILEIKRHLAISDISIKELTYAFGFDEPTNFAKFFKKFTKQSPLQFKKMLTK